jgi:hypothetical protein
VIKSQILTTMKIIRDLKKVKSKHQILANLAKTNAALVAAYRGRVTTPKLSAQAESHNIIFKLLSTCDKAMTTAKAVLPAEQYAEIMQVVLADLRPEEEEDSDMEKEGGVQEEQPSLKRAKGTEILGR